MLREPLCSSNPPVALSIAHDGRAGVFRGLRLCVEDTRGLPRHQLPASLRLDVHRKVTNTKAGVLTARRDLHARRARHNPCPAVDADRAGFRDDGLVAELTKREG